MKTFAIGKKLIYLHGNIMTFPMICDFSEGGIHLWEELYMWCCFCWGSGTLWNSEWASRLVVMWWLACFICVGFMSWEVWEACIVNKSLLFHFVCNLNILNIAAVLNEAFLGWSKTLAVAVSDLQLHPCCICSHFCYNLCPLGLILSVVQGPTWLSQRSLHLL